MRERTMPPKVDKLPALCLPVIPDQINTHVSSGAPAVPPYMVVDHCHIALSLIHISEPTRLALI
eukprot:11925140-Alexandrium_andersonii.AAC.1